jgi:hypothetical protein
MGKAKTIVEIRSLARNHTRTAIRVLVGIMRCKDATPAARVSAANAILDRGWGKATQPLENSGDGALELIHRIERVIFCQAGFPERGADHQTMTGEQAADVRAIVVETLAEQQRNRHDDIDAVVLKAVATTLTSFGIDEEDRKELRADFEHLRRWRRSVEQAQSSTFKADITLIVTTFVGAVWLGIKATLGK